MLKECICKQCGASFTGGPRASFCHSCRKERQMAREREYQRNKRAGVFNRKLGDTDTCAACGKKYVIRGGLQKYCPECAKIEAMKKDREQGLEYYREKKDEINDARNEKRRKLPAKPCKECGKMFSSVYKSEYCSEECETSSLKRKQRMRVSEQYKEMVINEWKNTANINDISKKYGVNKYTIYSWAQKIGIKIERKEREKTRTSRIIIPEEVKSKAVKEYMEGYTLAYIGAKYGVSQTTVCKWAKNAGVKRGYITPTSSIKDKIVEDYESGDNALILAERYKADIREIDKIISKNELNKNIIEEYRAGTMLSEIKRKYNVSIGKISYLARKNGIQKRTEKWGENIKYKISKEYISGESAKSLANKYGLNVNSLKAFLSENAIRKNKKVKLTTEMKKEILEGYKSGEKVSEIADKYDICLSSIYALIKSDASIQMRRKGRGSKFSDEIKEKVIKEYESGTKTIAEIKEKYRITDTTLYSWIKWNGSMSLRKSKFSDEIKAKALKECESGTESLEEIAEKYGITRNTLYEWRKSNNSVNLRERKKGGKGGRKSKLSDELKEKIVKECESGTKTLDEIAEKYGITKHTLYNWRKANGAIQRRKSRFSDELKEKAIKEYESGMKTLDEITEEYRVTRKTLYRWIKSNNSIQFRGNKRRRKSKFSNELKEQIIREYKSGMKITEIERKYKISTSTIQKLARENKLNKRWEEWGEELKESIFKEYREGESVKKLIEKYKITENSLKHLLAYNNVKRTMDKGRRNYKKVSEETRKKAVEKYLIENMTMKDVAKEYSVSVGVLCLWVKKYRSKNQG